MLYWLMRTVKPQVRLTCTHIHRQTEIDKQHNHTITHTDTHNKHTAAKTTNLA